MRKINRKSKHLLRRIAIVVVPLLLGIILGLIRLKSIGKSQIDISRMINVATTMLSLWGTSLGFVITAESILVAFDGSYLTKEIKKSAHFKTVIYTYTLTCIELLLMITIFSVAVIENYFSCVLIGVLIACLSIYVIDILLCLIFLGYLVASTCKENQD